MELISFTTDASVEFEVLDELEPDELVLEVDEEVLLVVLVVVVDELVVFEVEDDELEEEIGFWTTIEK